MQDNSIQNFIDEFQTTLDKIELQSKKVDVNLQGIDNLKTSIDDIKASNESLANRIDEAVNRLSQIEAPKVDVSVPNISLPEIKIPEIKLPEIKVPKAEVSVTLPTNIAKPKWFDLSGIDKILTLLKKLNLELPSKPEEAIPVRLSDGKKFIDSLTTAVVRAGSYAPAPFKNSLGNAQANVTETGDTIVVNQETVPTDIHNNNASIVVSYNAGGECVKIEKTINGVTYTKTITRVDNVVASTLPISAWS